jgi:hypothetical protein
VPETLSVTASDGATTTLGRDEDRPLRPGDLVSVTLAPEPPAD